MRLEIDTGGTLGLAKWIINDTHIMCFLCSALRRSEGNQAQFTIGTSDESEDDTADDEDLQKLFCPLTDSNGSPYDDIDSFGGDVTGLGQISASSCRKVHSEILASVTRIKCSLLGRKGGLLHSYTT